MTSYSINYTAAPTRYSIHFAKGTGPQGPAGGGVEGGSLTVRELDGSPSVTATELVFANGRLTVSGTVVTVAASNTIHSGEGAPENSLGIDGDFYFDELDFFFYGPKVAGAWADEYVIMSGSAGAASQVTSVSSSSVAIETGSKIFTIATSSNRGWTVGMRLRAAFDSINYVEGPITLLASTTVTINVDLAVGSGTRTSWNIGIAGDRGATGAAGSNGSNGATGATGAAGPNSVSSTTTTTLTGLLAGDGSVVSVATIGAGLQFTGGQLATSGVVLTTTSQSVAGVKTFSDAMDLAVQALNDQASITIDSSQSNKWHVTLAGNRVIENPTNSVDGRILILRIQQDANGGRTITWGAKFRFNGDLAIGNVVLSTGGGSIDRIGFEYVASDDRWDCVSFIKGS